MNVLSGHPRSLALQFVHESSVRGRSSKNASCLGSSCMELPCGGAMPARARCLVTGSHGRAASSRLVAVRVAGAGDSGESSSGGEDEEQGKEEEERSFGLSREDLERMVGPDDAKFNGLDLATLIRNKYGRSYDVQLIKKEFMGRNLLAMNVMWKYREQRSFPLTEEEYLLRLDDVANTLKCWGAVSHVRNTLQKLKERPRIGKAVSIFIDMDESGGRSNEWIYK